METFACSTSSLPDMFILRDQDQMACSFDVSFNLEILNELTYELFQILISYQYPQLLSTKMVNLIKQL